jgi:CubicO group peptidase (beta-lactamase class C family)
MKQIAFVMYLSFAFVYIQAQDLYFPPKNTSDWESLSFEELSWCNEEVPSLLNTLEDNQTKAFIILKDGKIVVEEYFNDFKQDSSWVWYSAAKSLTSFMMGLAQEQGALSINESSQKYLGEGWSELTKEQEEEIKILHHLTLTTGMDYTGDTFCGEPSCFQYLNPPGTHWYYHNATYVKTREILEAATQRNLNVYTFQNMHQTIGMDGFWLSTNSLNLYFSTARSMARFGLMMLNDGDWDGQVVMEDKTYFENMINSSQGLNPAYGYLWWLNGKSSFKLPSDDNVYQGKLSEYYPDDAFFALGAQSQILVVIPSQNVIIVRMGNEDVDSLVPLSILDEIGRHFESITCNSTAVKEEVISQSIQIIPNPITETGFRVLCENALDYCKVFDMNGHLVFDSKISVGILIKPVLHAGQYIIQFYNNSHLVESKKLLITAQ